MRVCRYIARPFMCLALLAFGAPAHAQIFGAGQWVRGMYLVDGADGLFPGSKALVDEGTAFILRYQALRRRLIPSCNQTTL